MGVLWPVMGSRPAVTEGPAAAVISTLSVADVPVTMPAQSTVSVCMPAGNGPAVWVPPVASAVPPYSQDIVSVLIQLNSMVTVFATTFVGSATTVTVGSGTAVSVAASLAEPSDPVQFTV